MLGKPHRFHGYNSLRPVYRQGHTARGPMLSLKFARRDPRKPYRVAVVVSRKVHKSAVTRNRIRRRIYENVRRNDTVIAPGTDLVFTVFSDQLAELDAPRLQKNIEQLLRQTAPND